MCDQKPHIFSQPSLAFPLRGHAVREPGGLPERGTALAVDEVAHKQEIPPHRPPHPSAFGCHLPLKGKAFPQPLFIFYEYFSH